MLCTILMSCGLVSGCSTNPATGESQFAALMSPEQENKIGADQHQDIIKLFGAPAMNDPVQNYVERIGQSISLNTERPEVNYRFFVLDTPMVNAFAVPGGYIYLSRGLLTQANSEAEVAAVLAHEVGHITARHSAERYSRGVLTSLGAAILSSAIDTAGASQALGIGSDLYIKSYSRNQEHQADELGIRYLARSGYNPNAMGDFLANLDQHSQFEKLLAGKGNSNDFSYFSTHPQTAQRVAESRGLAKSYPIPKIDTTNRDGYLKTIDGLVYGHSSREGFVRDNNFYHTKMGFTFSVPSGFRINNQPTQVVVSDDQGSVVIFDAKSDNTGVDPRTYLTNVWMQKEPLVNVESIEINGLPAATASFQGTVNNKAATIRVMAVKWDSDTFFRFQIAIPNGVKTAQIDNLKRITYSLRRLNEMEKRQIQPYRIKIVRAGAGDTVETLARTLPFDKYNLERFRTLNNLRANQALTQGELYKVIQ